MARIIELSPEIYNRIAAGEVIENPASAVKELVENSIDAHSSGISISIRQAGKKEIIVTDDGEGMSQDDLRLSIKKHTTSKIKGLDDLDRIRTLGFRGEALSSLVSVSLMEISSRPERSDTGLKLSVKSGGKEVKEAETAMPRGTSIRVSNLFYNTPARLKFLKSESRELVHIREMLNKMIIPHYNIRFEIRVDDENPVIYKKTENLLARLRDLYGPEFVKELLPVGYTDKRVKLSGFISKPSYSRSNRNLQLLFLNNRPILAKFYPYWLTLAYENLIMRNRFPAAFIFLEMDPLDFDVNVHPAKKEVRFSDEYNLGNLLISTIKSCLNEKVIIPEVGREQISGNGTDPGALKNKMGEGISRAIDTFLYKQADRPSYSSVMTARESVPDGSGAENRPCFSIFNTYLFYEDREKKEVLIIDQHAAHERIIYERLKRGLREKEEISQNLLIPINLHLSDAEYQIVMEHKGVFEEVGYRIEPFGGKTVVLNAIPAFLKPSDDRRLFLDILSDLLENKETDPVRMKEELIKSMACKAAVKAGDTLAGEQKESLINELLKTEGRYTCPHGRPAVIRLSMNEIGKWFHRK
ncbi:MAG: DNA mismatch repair endonuclease MutL [bacterium]|nr:DNA mismatch repair endonuclease MutL [bacterium]